MNNEGLMVGGRVAGPGSKSRMIPGHRLEALVLHHGVRLIYICALYTKFLYFNPQLFQFAL